MRIVRSLWVRIVHSEKSKEKEKKTKQSNNSAEGSSKQSTNVTKAAESKEGSGSSKQSSKMTKAAESKEGPGSSKEDVQVRGNLFTSGFRIPKRASVSESDINIQKKKKGGPGS